MVFSTALPAVVRRFMVIPDGDQRRSGPQGLKARIRVVLGVALAVVVEAEDLAVGQEATAAGGVFGGAIAAGAIFVDVVTHLKPGVIGVGAVDRRCPGIGVELLGRREVGAGEYGQPHRIAAHWQGLGLAHARDPIPSPKSVEVGGVGPEACRFHLHGPVAGGTGGEAAAAVDGTRRKVSAAGDLPLHILRAHESIGGADPSPEDHRIGVGIARGDTVGKADVGG